MPNDKKETQLFVYITSPIMKVGSVFWLSVDLLIKRPKNTLLTLMEFK